MKKRVLSIILVLVSVVSIFCGCSNSSSTNTEKNSKFRVTAYLRMDSLLDFDNFTKTHIDNVTDIILIDCARFDEEGKITYSDRYDEALANLKTLRAMSKDTKCHIAILGPGSQSDSDDWYEQMADQAQRHTNAFTSGNLEESIKACLEQGEYDGVFFDYEYALKRKYWKSFNNFIVGLDEYLGDGYSIGVALAAWDLGQNKKAMQSTDIVQIMSYDDWGEDGTHSTVEQAEKDIKTFLKHGYDASQLELGLPFYARPTTREAYWYGYNGYYEKLDEKGLCKDDETGLTFSFNTCDVIKEKTSMAVDMGLGGVMVWHWSCDVPADNEKSLFNAINEVVAVANMRDE